MMDKCLRSIPEYLAVCKHVFLHHRLRSSCIDIIPATGTALIQQENISSIREDIAYIVMPYPIQIIVVGIFSHGNFGHLSVGRDSCLTSYQSTLVDSRIHGNRCCRSYSCTKTNHFVIKKEPCLTGSSINVFVFILIRIGRCAIDTIRHSSGKLGGPSCLPVTA